MTAWLIGQYAYNIAVAILTHTTTVENEGRDHLQTIKEKRPWLKSPEGLFVYCACAFDDVERLNYTQTLFRNKTRK